MVIVDFETRSEADLLTVGTFNYCRHHSTEAICCGFLDLTSQRRYMWKNPKLYPPPQPFPTWLLDLLEDENVLVAAHSAEFDSGIWDYVAEPDHNFPMIEYNRWYCTSAMARVNALPGGLDQAIFASGGALRKDFKGKALIKACSIPPFDETPAALGQMADYCAQDILVAAELIRLCRPMTMGEHHDWLTNVSINERGVRVDRQLAVLAERYAGRETVEIAGKLSQLTDGTITKHTQTKRISEWVRASLEMDDTPTTVMERHKNGKLRYSIDKSVRAEMLDRPDLNLSDEVVEVLTLTDDGNRSSVAKFRKMRELANREDDRVRGAFVYAGASQTLRYASRGLQVHNMRRDCWNELQTEALKRAMAFDAELDEAGTVMDILSKMLRPAMIPEDGHLFIIGDWSAIEAMGLPWLAKAEDQLDIFRSGKDVYVEAATAMGQDNRQIGKVATLSLGYGGSNGAFSAMGRNYGLKLSDAHISTIVKRWRETNRWAQNFWRGLERAAMNAIQHPCTSYKTGRVEYYFQPDLLGGTLLCFLPGEVCIQYPRARMESTETPYGPRLSITAMKASWTPAADAEDWPRNSIWYGLLAENVTQAFCARLLRHAIDGLENHPGEGKVVMHTHDEIVLEAPVAEAYAAVSRLDKAMNTVPDFAEGLPLKATPIIKSRYGK